MVRVEPETPELVQVGEALADLLRPATGYRLPVVPGAAATDPGSLRLSTIGADPGLGNEGYTLEITAEGVSLTAPGPAGLFRGAQTLRQLFPPSIEASGVQAGPWTTATGRIVDRPRFEWRGAMLDVARHFFGTEDVKRFIDQMAAYKLNRLHLHLTDDQGWRLMIRAWPALASIGGSTAVGGDQGGFYTQEEYADLVAYAQDRQIVVVPEIDMPGHTQAALASVPELNPGGARASPYTGIEVGLSTLDAANEFTYRFVAGVVQEVAALTPGPYLHIGGDEAKATPLEDYRRFIERVQGLVTSAGRQMIGWEEIAQARLHSTTLAQHWSSGLAAEAVRQGSKVILSPATRAYLDMQYTPDFPLGTHWAGFVGVRDSYDWDPASQVPGITEADVLGIEAPLWTETVRTRAELERLAFPRLIGLAEIGWSPVEGRSWEEYRVRLAARGRRLDAMGVQYYRSPEVDWP